jgi:DNA-directed RNA polymerase subunit RPC12/RpoP
MASVIQIACPNCQKAFNAPTTVLGKKIKCKDCSHVFVATDPDDENKPAKGKPAVKPSKPGGTTTKIKKEKEEPKKEEKKEEPKPASTYKFEDDDDSATPSPLGVIDEGFEIPRCPHCAKELDPPDAKVCLNCGFNTLTRVRAESKKVWAPDTNDWITHLAPGVIALIICIIILVIDIVSWVNMRDWMTDSFLQKDDEDINGVKGFWVKPGAFITFVIVLGVMPFAAAAKFAYRRLAVEYQPQEKEKKK